MFARQLHYSILVEVPTLIWTTKCHTTYITKINASTKHSTSKLQGRANLNPQIAFIICRAARNPEISRSEKLVLEFFKRRLIIKNYCYVWAALLKIEPRQEKRTEIAILAERPTFNPFRARKALFVITSTFGWLALTRIFTKHSQANN